MKKILVLGCALLLAGFFSCEQAGGLVPNESGDQLDGSEEDEEDEEEPPALVGIGIASRPDKTIYPSDYATREGWGLDWTGLVVNGVYDDGHTEVLAEETDYRIDTPEITEGNSGKFTVWVYSEKVQSEENRWASFLISISNSTRVLTGVTLNTLPPANQVLGANFNTGSMKITGSYTEGDPEVLDSKLCKIIGYDPRKRGIQTVTFKINGITVLENFEVNTKVPASGVTVKAIIYPNFYIPGQTSGPRPVYLKGETFNLAASGLAVSVEVNGKTIVLTHASGGLLDTDALTYKDNGSSAATLDRTGMRTLNLALDNDHKAAFSVYVADIEPQVYFDYGYMRHSGDPTGKGPGAGSYWVKQGGSLVLAPVRYLIGFNADHSPGTVSYNWTVSGGGYNTTQPQNEETFTFIPSAAGVYEVSVNVTGCNFLTGNTDTKTATTKVYCGQTDPSLPATFLNPRKDFAPGQFTEQGTGYGWSLGAALGYEMWAVPAGTTQVSILGNGFQTWSEPGIVWIQGDDNGNGRPDEMWHEVPGSDDNLAAYKDHILRRHAITYFNAGENEGVVNQYGQTIRPICLVDSRGRMGVLAGGWPTVGNTVGITGVAGDWITYTGTLLRDGGNTINMSGYKLPDISGYVDTYNATDGQTLKVNASSAIRANGTGSGLSSIRFVKVQTAYFDYGGSVGEISTEIVSATGIDGNQSGGFPNPLTSVR